MGNAACKKKLDVSTNDVPKSQSKPILYHTFLSAAARTVHLVGREIGLEFELREVNLLKGENKTPEFEKLNPQHTLPVLDDNGVIIWDSHAIATYLIGKYAANDNLYPIDLHRRARVDQRLHFDSAVLFNAIRNANYAIFGGGSEVPEDKIADLHAALALLEAFLTGSEYLVGNSLTVADFACVATVSSYQMHITIEPEQYPNVTAWFKRLSALPYYDEMIVKPTADLTAWITDMKQKNAAGAA